MVVATLGVPVATSAPTPPDTHGQLLIVLFTGVSAVALILTAWFTYRAARAPLEMYEVQRHDAEPRIVVEAVPRWEHRDVRALWIVPAGQTGGIVAGLALSDKRRSVILRNTLNEEMAPLGRVLLRITNAGNTVSVGLRVPLRFSFAHLGKDPYGPDDPSAIGSKRETISHDVTLEIPSLPPGDYPVWVFNDGGVEFRIESTGEAFDMDPRAPGLRTLAASSPAPITLKPQL